MKKAFFSTILPVFLQYNTLIRNQTKRSQKIASDYHTSPQHKTSYKKLLLRIFHLCVATAYILSGTSTMDSTNSIDRIFYILFLYGSIPIAKTFGSSRHTPSYTADTAWADPVKSSYLQYSSCEKRYQNRIFHGNGPYHWDLRLQRAVRK